MESNLNDVFQQAVQLPERDRATLAGLLIETLDPVSEPDVEAAWSEEIERRLAEIDAGTVELIPWETVRAELFGESELELSFTLTLAPNFAPRAIGIMNAAH